MRSVLFFLLTFLAFWGCAQVPTPKVQSQQSNATNYLWHVKGPTGQAWLLGAVHVLRRGSRLDASVMSAYDKADTLAVEVDVLAMSGTDMVDMLANHGTLPEGQTLEALLGAEDFKRLKGILAKADAKLPQLQTHQPWVVTQYLVLNAQPLAPQKKADSAQDSKAASSGDPDQGEGQGDGPLAGGVDRFFLATAKETARPIHALETIDEQGAALSSASLHLQAEELRQTMDAMEAGLSPADAILDLYFDGELESMAKEMQNGSGDASGKESQNYYEKINTQRNLRMAQRLDALLKSGKRPFVVVGALHLVGAGSIQEVLSSLGYTVTPVPKSGRYVEVKAPKTGTLSLPKAKVMGFHLDWPVAPEASDVRVGEATVKIWKSIQWPVSFVYQSEKLAGAAMLSLPQIYDMTLQVMARTVKMDVVEERAVKVSGLHASRYILKNEQMQMRGLNVWADGRLYSLITAVPASLASDERLSVMEVFLDSFALDLYDPEVAHAAMVRAVKMLEEKPAALYPAPVCMNEWVGKATQILPEDDRLCVVDGDDCLKRCLAGDGRRCLALSSRLEKHKPAVLEEFHSVLLARACLLGVVEGCSSHAGLALVDDVPDAEPACHWQTIHATCDKGEPWGCAWVGLLLKLGKAPATANTQGLTPGQFFSRACALEGNQSACEESRNLAKAWGITLTEPQGREEPAPSDAGSGL